MSVLLKYCGHQSLSDLQKGIKSCADYLGIIFAESKRKVDAHEAKTWLKMVDLGKKQLVGVFVNSSAEDIYAVTELLPLSVIQCHGTETVEQIAKIKAATDLPVWKAIHHSEEALSKMRQYATVADGYIVDSRVKGAWGGTGISFNWEAIPFYLEEANRQGVPCFIAGGITPDNVAQLLSYRPHGVDISSGIEENGKKSARKMMEIEKRVKHDVQGTK
ncbi:phosphoribosylanthranilate isomerase [Anoxybacillus rupiensis]|jgi:phosphoribosylanthranilate isomerase|uniref:N-(5'-phosphoribosyl)anthranilate isomerase n=1 Tax=Anoxybacteroides rupiense TaxID=311460 RepID=A0ABT5W0R0_9BACL|nr:MULTISPECIES: phosphoribosylanthranilate isomerase [Anoxybacillus]MDE8562359.1 phosphoribosylanthranilate isomerase [Anoxybacillus rupiensis]QHC04549.1 phosphoribosylanthranilate isomerase [Anoxybacillus sp. PDR2]